MQVKYILKGFKMIGVIVQAKTKFVHSQRGIFADINGKYTLQRILDGVTSSKLAHKIILSMPEYDRDEIKSRVEKGELNDYIKHRGFSIYCGDPDNAVQQIYDTSGINGLDLIVRISGNCPFIQGNIIDDMLHVYLQSGYNGYMSNSSSVCDKPFPVGLEVEIFPWWLLVSTIKHKQDFSFMYKDGVSDYNRGKVYQFNNHNRITTKHMDISFNSSDRYELIKDIAEKYDKCGDLNAALVMT
jgi:spore coat polysaccharide biosynthesis protein SpsF (cytidylyltransferase family)